MWLVTPRTVGRGSLAAVLLVVAASCEAGHPNSTDWVSTEHAATHEQQSAGPTSTRGRRLSEAPPASPPFATDLSLSLGSVLSLQDGAAAAHPTVGRLNATRAVACWVDDANYDYLRCAALTLQGATALAMGPVTTVRQYTRYPSVASLAEDKAVVCWLDDGVGAYGTCAVLLVAADGTITAGNPAYFRASSLRLNEPSVSVTALDGEWSVACCRYSSYTRCVTLNVAAGSSTTISVGTLFYVALASTGLVPAVTAFDAASALLCYRDPIAYGECVVLTRSGSTLSAGSSTYFYSGNMGYVATQTSSWVSAFSATSAIACYRASSHSNEGRCTLLSRASPADTSVTAGATVAVNAGATYSPSVAALDAQLALVCYQGASGSSAGTCKRLWRDGALLCTPARSWALLAILDAPGRS